MDNIIGYAAQNLQDFAQQPFHDVDSLVLRLAQRRTARRATFIPAQTL